MSTIPRGLLLEAKVQEEFSCSLARNHQLPLESGLPKNRIWSGRTRKEKTSLSRKATAVVELLFIHVADFEKASFS
jgi:hypothetical protein